MIRNVSDKTTSAIGAIRYAENGVTSKIPVAYVVDAGKTVVLYKESTGGNGGDSGDGLDDSYTYLYRNGSFTDLVTGITKRETGGTITETSDGLVFEYSDSQDYKYASFRTNNQVPERISYTKIGILYDYTGPDMTNNSVGSGLEVKYIKDTSISSQNYIKVLHPSASETNKIEYVPADINKTYLYIGIGVYLDESNYGTALTWKIKAIWFE